MSVADLLWSVGHLASGLIFENWQVRMGDVKANFRCSKKKGLADVFATELAGWRDPMDTMYVAQL